MNARKAQFGAQLRFFRQLVTAAKVPHVAELARKYLARKDKEYCVVIGLQSTGAIVISFMDFAIALRFPEQWSTLADTETLYSVVVGLQSTGAA